MIGLPPSDTGVFHRTVSNMLPGVSETMVGAPGRVAGVAGADASDAGPVPTALVAVTVKVYAVPLVSPVMLQVVPGVAPPGLAVTV